MGRRNESSNETSDDDRGVGEAERPDPENRDSAEGADDRGADDHGADGCPDGCDEPPAWDADDERRQRDCFAPPRESCECYCLHCQRTFSSDEIWFQRVIGDPMGLEGFWMCPTANCDGAGFTFDIFPTDPDHPANEGWTYDDDEEDPEFEPDEDAGSAASWDPAEAKYKELDEIFGDGPDDDIEGEEWKYGLEPGERPPEPDWVEAGRREREEEERRYNEPDERPRVLDWTNREDRAPRQTPSPFPDDDIPF